MYSFKEFVYNQRKPELTEPYIFISENITDTLYEFIQDFDKLTYNPEKCYTYYGVVRRYVENFNIFWNFVVSDCDAAYHYLKDSADKDILLKIIRRTKNVQCYKQDKFRISFTPVATSLEQTRLKEIEELFEKRLIDLDRMEHEVKSFRFDREVKEFCNYHVALSLQKKVESLSCTHMTIAMRIADQSGKVRASLDGVLKILRQNLVTLLEDYQKKEKKLLNELYDLNKYRLELTRRMDGSVTDVAHEDQSINKVTNRIQENAKHKQAIVTRVQSDLKFWEKRYSEFMEIYQINSKCLREIEKVRMLKKTFIEMSANNKLHHLNRGCKKFTFGYGGLLDKRESELIDIWKKVARTMFTFFTIRGFDEVRYKDSFGTFHIDEYGHKLYHFNYGETAYHTDCYGNFFEPVVEKYQFDQCGKYYIDEEGEKVYQCGACTSKYKIDVQGLLQKITKDCGHSEKYNPKCKMETKVPVFALLPDVEPVDIKNKLKPETVKYLMDTFGHILPEAIKEVFKCNPRTPTSSLAHNIIKFGYKDYDSKIHLEKAKKLEKAYYEEKNKKAAEQKKEIYKTKIKRLDATDMHEDEDTKMACYLLWEKNEFENIVAYNNLSQ